MKAFFISFGCKVNQYETEGMKSFFEKNGFDITNNSKSADAIIINSCTVTSNGESKVIHAIKRLRRNNPNAVIALTGCLPQAFPEKASELTDADIITGTKMRLNLPELVKKELEQRRHTVCIEQYSGTEDFENLSCTQFRDKTRAFVKIQDGCNQFCSYCIIPYVRGRVRSRRPEDVADEVRRLAENGYREVVLTGIHLSSYGIDLGTSLLELIKAVHETEGIERIRLGSLEPRIITEEFARELASLPKVCPHFHLSLQSGCDATLKRMNRRYTAEEYAEKCGLLRRYFDDPALTTDVIVGFPGETKEEFETTRAFLEDLKLYETHIFKYSRRKGTRADAMPDQVSDEEKGERSAVLLALNEKNREAFENRRAGREDQVLFEEYVSLDGRDYYVGHTREYVKLAVLAEENYANQILSVRVGEERRQGILVCSRQF